MSRICTAEVIWSWIQLENKTRNYFPCASKFKEVNCDDENMLKELFMCLKSKRNYIEVLPSDWGLRELDCNDIFDIELIGDWTEAFSRSYLLGRKNNARNAAETIRNIMCSGNIEQEIEKLAKAYRTATKKNVQDIKHDMFDVLNNFDKVRSYLSYPLILECVKDKLRIIDGDHRAIVAAVECLNHKSVTLRAYVGRNHFNYAREFGLR
ncbi:hypothetical protein [Acidianus sp. HS-5]|uniref:hypothetical protein n=1 Tax=Acidianus sp. HS-5 TaxID=2886040 RepID=UPI001F33A94F|nr:hypothetical protein [Acidianus sp. HS-5]BDC17440.1 hypothetical protein HS5_03300 [Acidianus sp. HS-5]